MEHWAILQQHVLSPQLADAISLSHFSSCVCDGVVLIIMNNKTASTVPPMQQPTSNATTNQQLLTHPMPVSTPIEKHVIYCEGHHIGVHDRSNMIRLHAMILFLCQINGWHTRYYCNFTCSQKKLPPPPPPPPPPKNLFHHQHQTIHFHLLQKSGKTK